MSSKNRLSNKRNIEIERLKKVVVFQAVIICNMDIEIKELKQKLNSSAIVSIY